MKHLLKHMSIVLLLIIGLTATALAQHGDSTLHFLITKALENSKQVEIQALQIQKAKLDQKRALQTYLPEINVQGSQTRLNSQIELPQDMQTLLMGTQALLIKERAGVPFNTPLPAEVSLKQVPPVQNQNILKASISGTMVIFSGLEVPNYYKAAMYKEQALQELSKNQKANVIKEVTAAYDQLAVLRTSENVFNETEKLLNEQSRFVDKAVKNGLATSLESSQIELAQQQLEVKRIELYNSKQLLYARLSQLTGLSADEFDGMNPELKEWEVSSIDNTAFHTHPNIKALDASIKALEYKRKAEYASYAPKAAMFGKRELLTQDLSIFDPIWMVGVSVKWNIFDGLKAANQAQQTKVDQQILLNQKEEATDLLKLNADNKRFELEKHDQLVGVAKKQLETARKAYELSKKQYQVGLLSMNDHLRMVNEVEKAQLNLIKTKYDQRQAAIAYLEAQGQLSVDTLK